MTATRSLLTATREGPLVTTARGDARTAQPTKNQPFVKKEKKTWSKFSLRNCAQGLERPAPPNSVTQWNATILRFLDMFRKPDAITCLNPAWTDFMVWRVFLSPDGKQRETQWRKKVPLAPPFRPAICGSWVHSLLSFRQASLLSVDITPGVLLELQNNTLFFFSWEQSTNPS